MPMSKGSIEPQGYRWRGKNLFGSIYEFQDYVAK